MATPTKTKRVLKAKRPHIVDPVTEDTRAKVNLVQEAKAERQYQQTFDGGENNADRRKLRSIKKRLAEQPHFRVMIQPVEMADGTIDNSDVPIGINGYFIQCQRGVEVTLPQTAVEFLENAKIETFKHEVDPMGMKPTRVVPVEYQRYPFSVLGPAKRK